MTTKHSPGNFDERRPLDIVRQNLRAIIGERDRHAETGEYSPNLEADQCFDDWAADVAQEALAALDRPTVVAVKHSPETWTVDDNCIKGEQADMYPILFERVHATEADMRLAAAAPALRDALRLMHQYFDADHSDDATRIRSTAAALLDSLS
jgi:hypothetical protein